MLIAVALFFFCLFMTVFCVKGQQAVLNEIESGPATYQLAKFTDEGKSDYYLIQDGTTLKYLYAKDGKFLIGEAEMEDVNIHLGADVARVVICEKTTQSRPQFLFLYGNTEEDVTHEIDFYIPDGNAIAYNGRIGD